VREHNGQISFPGGAYEEEDGTLLTTALRESFEEIGLRADEVEILGELDDTPTNTTDYLIAPFVGFIRPRQFRMDRREIEEIFEVPVSVLLDEKRRPLDGEAVPTYTYRYQGKVIWGATARILDQFLDIWTVVLGDQTARAGNSTNHNQ
jgi:8-oxo-dGTP pyrophosphatase MutT (NUDIX family)